MRSSTVLATKKPLVLVVLAPLPKVGVAAASTPGPRSGGQSPVSSTSSRRAAASKLSPGGGRRRASPTSATVGGIFGVEQQQTVLSAHQDHRGDGPRPRWHVLSITAPFATSRRARSDHHGRHAGEAGEGEIPPRVPRRRARMVGPSVPRVALEELWHRGTLGRDPTANHIPQVVAPPCRGASRRGTTPAGNPARAGTRFT